MIKIIIRITVFCSVMFILFVAVIILHVYPGLWVNRGGAMAAEERYRQNKIRREIRLLELESEYNIFPNNNFIEIIPEIRELIKNVYKEEDGRGPHIDFRFSPSFFELKERSNEVRAVALELFRNGDLNWLEELILLIVLNPANESWRKVAW